MVYNSLMIMYAPLPAKTFEQPQRECKGDAPLALLYSRPCGPAASLPAARLSSRAVTF